MENLFCSSIWFLIGGVIGFLINSYFTLRSQKITLENFYAEPFLKEKAERIIKLLDCFVEIDKIALYKSKNPNLGKIWSEEIDKCTDLIHSIEPFLENSRYEKINKFISITYEFLENLKSNKDNSIKTNEIFNNWRGDLKSIRSVLGELLPKDYLLNKLSI